MITNIKIISLGFLSVGVFVLMQVILPIISFQLWEIGQRINGQILISPKPLTQTQVLGISIESQDNFPTFVSSLERDVRPNYSEFSLTVPSLKINKEQVLVDSNDLNKILAHLPGSALPGEKGNVFISGHSAVSWLFKNQKAIFVKLQDIKKGDQIKVTAGGIDFNYEVIELKIVNPTDLSVIQPPDNLGRYITLMTCVPPGLNTKRLIVLGKMI